VLVESIVFAFSNVKFGEREVCEGQKDKSNEIKIIVKYKRRQDGED
jgi:hypothetical protein